MQVRHACIGTVDQHCKNPDSVVNGLATSCVLALQWRHTVCNGLCLWWLVPWVQLVLEHCKLGGRTLRSHSSFALKAGLYNTSRQSEVYHVKLWPALLLMHAYPVVSGIYICSAQYQSFHDLTRPACTHQRRLALQGMTTAAHSD